jgi:hypothetical protein
MKKVAACCSPHSMPGSLTDLNLSQFLTRQTTIVGCSYQTTIVGCSYQFIQQPNTDELTWVVWALNLSQRQELGDQLHGRGATHCN